MGRMKQADAMDEERTGVKTATAHGERRICSCEAPMPQVTESRSMCRTATDRLPGCYTDSQFHQLPLLVERGAR
jgi:hypothetical protein